MVRNIKALLGALGAPLLAISAAAQTAAPAPIVATLAPPAPAVSGDVTTATHLAPRTLVDIEIAEPLGSKTSHIGDVFAIRLAAPVLADNKVVLPAGIEGRGEVIHAARSGFGGKAGELIVAARYLQCGETRIPLGHFHFGQAGKDRFGDAFGVSMAVPIAGFFINGGEVTVAPGTHANAQITADVDLPSGAAACAHG